MPQLGSLLVVANRVLLWLLEAQVCPSAGETPLQLNTAGNHDLKIVAENGAARAVCAGSLWSSGVDAEQALPLVVGQVDRGASNQDLAG